MPHASYMCIVQTAITSNKIVYVAEQVYSSSELRGEWDMHKNVQMYFNAFLINNT